MNEHSQAVSLAGIISESRAKLGASAGALVAPSIVLGVLSSGPVAGYEVEPAIGATLAAIVAAVVGGGVLFGIYVWALRRAAVGLGVVPHLVSFAAVLWTGLLASAIIVVGSILLVVPGICAYVLLGMAAPIVAFEGVTGADALRASSRAVRRAPWTVAGLLLLVFFAPMLLDIGYWPVAVPTWFIIAWQVVLYAAASMFATVAIGVACIQIRTQEVAMVSSGDTAFVPGMAGLVDPCTVSHPWTAPPGATSHGRGEQAPSR